MIYGPEFYQKRYANTIYSARKISEILFNHCLSITSAVDFGCGVGTWLAALKEKGVKRILGVEGSWVDRNCLVIDSEQFRSYDLKKTVNMDERFDLAMSLEVAEHLPPERADSFVEDLCRASDLVLFSAAIPGQSGVNHINEQWPDYWQKLFKKRGYVAVDFIRSKIWNDKKIELCYRQNILLYANEIKLVELFEEIPLNLTPMSIVHPEFYSKGLRRLNKTRSFKGILSLAMEWLKKIWRKNK